MAKERLTAGRIREFKLPEHKQQDFLWDTEVPQLALRITKGAKSYIFETRINRKKMRATIGAISTWSIDKAREEARRLQILVDQGLDPRDEKAKKAAESEARKQEVKALHAETIRQKIIIADAWKSYLEARRPRWGDHHYQDHLKLSQPGGTLVGRGKRRLSTAGPLASLMPHKLSDLSADGLRSWLEDETNKRPTVTARAYRLLRAFLNWCSERSEYSGIIDPSIILTKEVRETVASPKVKSDCLQKEQLQAWFDAVKKNTNPIIPAYLQTLLLTGARREELAELTWEALDFQWLSITMKDKVEDERIIPLTPYVSALLNALPRRNKWVFSSPSSASGHLKEPSIFHRKAVAAAGLPPLSLHGLRRSFGTLAEWVEMPTGIVAQIQGHKPSALIEKHYRHRPIDLLRKWHTKLEEWILDQAGIEQPAKHQSTQKLHQVK